MTAWEKWKKLDDAERRYGKELDRIGRELDQACSGPPDATAVCKRGASRAMRQLARSRGTVGPPAGGGARRYPI